MNYMSLGSPRFSIPVICPSRQRAFLIHATSCRAVRARRESTAPRGKGQLFYQDSLGVAAFCPIYVKYMQKVRTVR